jgi:hypothetical protein
LTIVLKSRALVHRPLSVLSGSDPSRTTVLRLAFIRALNARYRELAQDVRVSIVDRDTFGIQAQPSLAVARSLDSRSILPRSSLGTLSPTLPRQFAFQTTERKVAGFLAWLEEQQSQGILQLVRSTRAGGFTRFGAVSVEEPWTNLYIDSAYRKAVWRKRTELVRAGAEVVPVDAIPGGVGAIMNQPVHAERLAILYSRTFEDLKTAASAVNAEARRKLIDGLTTGLTRGLAEGKSPLVIAREISRDVVGRYTEGRHGIVRARAIARTEINRAHNSAAMAEFREARRQTGRDIRVDVEVGVGDDANICQDLRDAVPYTLEEADGLLPAHVN